MMRRVPIRKLRGELQFARERITELEEHIRNGAGLLEDGTKENPFFGGLFGDGKRKSSKAAPKSKSFSVFFEDAAGDGRNLSIQAPNKTEARRMAKEWMREEGENLRGATFEIEAD